MSTYPVISLRLSSVASMATALLFWCALAGAAFSSMLFIVSLPLHLLDLVANNYFTAAGSAWLGSLALLLCTLLIGTGISGRWK